MENCFFWDKSILFLSFVSNIAHPVAYLFPNIFGNFKIGVAYKRLAYKKRANSNTIADRNNKLSVQILTQSQIEIINFFANETVMVVLELYK